MFLPEKITSGTGPSDKIFLYFFQRICKNAQDGYITFFRMVFVLKKTFEHKEVLKMKKGIHPNYGPATVTCACGKVWEIKSTRKEYKVGICAECHPFFTGKQKLVDIAGRVEKFRRRYDKKASE